MCLASISLCQANSPSPSLYRSPLSNAEGLSSLGLSGLVERTPVCWFMHFVAFMLKLGLKMVFCYFAG